MGYIDLIRREPRPLVYGVAFTFASSAGQTFFISLFVPFIAASLHINVEQMGYLYGAATIGSAVLLPIIGRLIDKVDLLPYGIISGLMLFLASAGMATSASMVMVFTSLVALRLFGQGLLTHTAMTAISRYFAADRGKALSITSLGHAAGEALLPLTALAMVAAIGWRYTLVLYGTMLGLLVSLSASLYVRNMKSFRRAVPKHAAVAGRDSATSIWHMPAFWAFVPSMVAVPFALTALIFHQGLLASGFNLSLTAFATGFVFFALMQIPGAVLGGRWTDQTSARFLMPWHIVPAMAGILIFAMAGTTWATIVYLAFAGFSSGWSNVLRSAIIAEMVLAESIGAARSIATSFMVLSTAAGPALFGFLYSQGIDASGLLWAAFLALGIAGIAALAGYRLLSDRGTERAPSPCVEEGHRNES